MYNSRLQMSRNRQSQRPRRVLINYPRAFFEVNDVRPDESQELAKANSEAVFVSGGISIIRIKPLYSQALDKERVVVE